MLTSVGSKNICGTPSLLKDALAKIQQTSLGWIKGNLLQRDLKLKLGDIQTMSFRLGDPPPFYAVQTPEYDMREDEWLAQYRPQGSKTTRRPRKSREKPDASSSQHGSRGRGTRGRATRGEKRSWFLYCLFL
eukprot:Pompholyxophrys_punicea_v1_NODE_290_length_2356_cov_40.811280.p3 type:complete len:132 gc:universal NODE_290_length_2356_cov_40.811280:1289-1684(+)